jgi:hypothetical protein
MGQYRVTAKIGLGPTAIVSGALGHAYARQGDTESAVDIDEIG